VIVGKEWFLLHHEISRSLEKRKSWALAGPFLSKILGGDHHEQGDTQESHGPLGKRTQVSGGTPP
jgi:hypothetical protein